MEKQPPFNEQYEQNVLGIILKDSSKYFVSLQIITAKMFYSDKHRFIFEAFDNLSLNNQPIDLLTTTSELRKANKLEDVGGSYYLTQLINSIVSTNNIEHYCIQVFEDYQYRFIIKISKHLIEEAHHRNKEAICSWIERLNGYAQKSNNSLSEMVKEFVLSTSGNFLSTDVYTCLQVSTREDKKNVSIILKRLSEQGIIEKDKHQNAKWRRVDDTVEIIDLDSEDEEKKDIVLPLGLDKICYLHPKNIMIIAGVSETGKTAWLLNIAQANQLKNDVYYFSSEMGSKELKERLKNFDYGINSFKKITFINRGSNFEDIIKPDAINIIDFLEIHEEHYKIGVILKRIYDKLTTGVAIIAIQKDAKKEFGVGGNVTQEKARIYLNLDHQDGYSTATIVKGKNWTNPRVSPSHRKLDYWVINGSKLKPKSGWYKENEEEIPCCEDVPL